MTDYSNLVYIHDKEGAEYACPMDALKGNLKKAHDLTAEQKERCIDLSLAIDQFWG